MRFVTTSNYHVPSGDANTTIADESPVDPHLGFGDVDTVNKGSREEASMIQVKFDGNVYIVCSRAICWRFSLNNRSCYMIHTGPRDGNGGIICPPSLLADKSGDTGDPLVRTQITACAIVNKNISPKSSNAPMRH